VPVTDTRPITRAAFPFPIEWGPDRKNAALTITVSRMLHAECGADLAQSGQSQGNRPIPPEIACIPAEKLDFAGLRRHVWGMNVQRIHPRSADPFEQVSFDRRELGEILGLYGRFVAAGIWRDYGISCLRERAVFAVFRHAAENPRYRIEKIPALRHKQGLYALFGPEGQVLKRGATLRGVMAPLERKLLRALD